MKVLFASQTEITGGGVERWLELLANGLADRGIDVNLALANGPYRHDADRYLARYPSLERHEIIIAKNGSGTRHERCQSLTHAIRKVSPDVLVPVLLEDSLEIVRNLRSSGRACGAVVYPVHENEIWVEQSVRNGLDVIDHVVCSNKIMTEHLRAAFPSLEARCSHVRVGVPRASRQAPHWKGGRPTSIGFCGKIVRECKRAPDFAEFVNALSRSGHSIEVLVAGDGPYREEFLRVLSASVGTESVRYLGLVDTSRLYQDFYPQLDLLVVTSETETGPMVAWEAMMHRVLLLTSDFMGRRFEGALEDGINCIVFPVAQPDEAVTKFLEAARRPDILEAIRDRGRIWAEEHASEAIMLDKTEALLRMVASTPRSQQTMERAGTIPQRRAIVFREAVESMLRRVTKRPRAYSSGHGEWPRYAQGDFCDANRQDFRSRLRQLQSDTIISEWTKDQ